jgi:hypothetical protein
MAVQFEMLQEIRKTCNKLIILGVHRDADNSTLVIIKYSNNDLMISEINIFGSHPIIISCTRNKASLAESLRGETGNQSPGVHHETFCMYVGENAHHNWRQQEIIVYNRNILSSDENKDNKNSALVNHLIRRVLRRLLRSPSE